MTLTLRQREHPLAAPDAQRTHLESLELSASFEDQLRAAELYPLTALGIDTLQINLGKQCNQACSHCHVDAGPDRKEIMSDAIVEACLRLLIDGGIPALDITGGAPEMHPRFRDIVREAARAGRHVMHRCNLTALLLAPYADIASLLAEHRVEVIASLPYYLPKQTDAQRGEGVFEASLRALQMLNELGYGKEGSGLVLDLVTNPAGAFLPANQQALERDWKRELERRYGIVFSHLYTITNMPISRFLEFLVASNNLESYMTRLVNAFNPAAAKGVMCRSLLSVGYDGILYDCDFNQMLEMPVEIESAAHILHLGPEQLIEHLSHRKIATAPHCFGCTAGAGSSCGGATA